MKDPTVVARKVAVLGARAVGKSCFVASFVTGTFNDGYDPTIESTHHKVIRFRQVHFVTDIVDTAGMVRVCCQCCVFVVLDRVLNSPMFVSQDDYSRLSRNASLGVDGYILVFSIVSRQSFEKIRQINTLLLNTLGDVPYVPRVLVGTMKDLAEQRQVNQAVSFAFAAAI